MKHQQRRYVRQMPKIYGNLHKEPRSLSRTLVAVQIVLWIGAIASLAYAFWFSDWFHVHNIDIQGVRFSSSDRIKKLTPLGGSIWSISTDNLAKEIRSDEQVQSVQVLRGLPDSLRIIVQERVPALLWQSAGTTTVLDTGGVAFLQYPSGQLPDRSQPAGLALAPLIKVQDTTNLPASLGHQMVTAQFVQFVNAVNQDLQQKIPTLTLDHFEIAATTYDVTMRTKQGAQIQMNSLADPHVQMRNLTRLFVQKKASLTSRIDLRIDRWAYVQ